MCPIQRDTLPNRIIVVEVLMLLGTFTILIPQMIDDAPISRVIMLTTCHGRAIELELTGTHLQQLSWHVNLTFFTGLLLTVIEVYR